LLYTPIGYTIRPMAHTHRDKKKLLTRVRRIAGQVAALERALESESDDCAQVLVQIAAAKGAMHALMMEVLAGHVSEHIVAVDSQAERAREANAIMELLTRYAR
jgi:DNA-binding FrmR family transcriptional regulator